MTNWTWMFGSAEPDGSTVYEFAAEQSGNSVLLALALESQSAKSAAPELYVEAGPPGHQLSVAGAGDAGRLSVQLLVPAAADPDRDDEIVAVIRDRSACAVPTCRVVLRRSICGVGTALIERAGDSPPVRRQTRAALLWHACSRYREWVGLKRFTSGRSGNDVLVFRPRLSEPGSAHRAEPVTGVLANSWGACLLVKTGRASKIREEWSRFRQYLGDRMHPFMARCELVVWAQSAGAVADGVEPDATIFGSFLGGDLLAAESLEETVRGRSDVKRCLHVLDKLFAVMSAWYDGNTLHPLDQWPEFASRTAGEGLILFGRYDFALRADRQRFVEPLLWDVAFAKEEHLRVHLLGRGNQRDGLLYRLLRWEVRYSLIHGDLHARNVLADQEHVWLLDFGKTGLGPTLFDFAKLEVYLRLWCLDLAPTSDNGEDAAMEFETQLLDHMTGMQATLEPVRRLSGMLGAREDELYEIAECIASLRKHAVRYGLGMPDRRDYLAVLYLTVLHTLQFAGRESHLANNFRMLLGLFWVLEDILSRMTGLTPFNRGRKALDPKRLVSQDWIAAPGAPGRAAYVLARPDGVRLFEPLATTRGVLQNRAHHLDVFDHTLLVLAYVERLLVDPVAGLLDPAGLDRQVAADLERQGLRLQPFASPAPDPSPPQLHGLEPLLGRLRDWLAIRLDETSRLVLKWGALFHDVGKPGTRTLNEHSLGDRVQFLGHELYGCQIIQGHLNAILLEPCAQDSAEMSWREDAGWTCPQCGGARPAGPSDRRARVAYLVRQHLMPYALYNRYVENPALFAELIRGASTGAWAKSEWEALRPYADTRLSSESVDFPLLLLHSYADRLATRGAGSDADPRRFAEVVMLLLGVCLRLPEYQDQTAAQEHFDHALRPRIGEALGLKDRALGEAAKRLRPWYLDERRRRFLDGRDGPSDEEVVQQARKAPKNDPD